MKEAVDLASVRMTLRHMVDKGWVPGIETFDTPSPGFVNNTGADRRTFPGGYTGVPFRNLLRDDFHPEAVEAAPDPRDFAESKPTLRRTEPQIFNPEPTDQGMGTGAVECHRDNEPRDEPASEGSNREGQAELGTEGSAAPSVRGESLDW